MAEVNQIQFEARVRSPKASERQKEELIRYFEETPNALRTVNGSENRAKQKIWIELTHRLNLLDGALKTTTKWSKYWNDIIIYTKTRAKSFVLGEYRCDRAPTEIERRLLTLVGHLSLLNMWIEVWEKGGKSQNEQHGIKIENHDEDMEGGEGDGDSPQHSLVEFEVREYETVMIESQEDLAEDPKSNMKGSTIHPVTIGKREENRSHERDKNSNSNTNILFTPELIENVRVLGNSFSNIGVALNNIALLLERQNSS